MTVDELIEELKRVEDRSLEVEIPTGEIVSVDVLTTCVLLADE